MENNFVSYNQALALKELGFDEDCLGYHNIDPYLPNPIFNLIRPFGHEWCLPTPLKQQVFRWFREKYELGHTICPYYFNANITELQDVDDYPLQHEVYVSSSFTYEEAENACIDKLIEIAKQQDSGK